MAADLTTYDGVLRGAYMGLVAHWDLANWLRQKARATAVQRWAHTGALYYVGGGD